LNLIPTLLDGYTRYRLEDLPKILSYLDSLGTLLNHPQVLLVDVKNEADLDFEQAGINRARAFLGYILSVTRDTFQKPVMVGLTDIDPVLSSNSDVLSVHHFDSAANLAARLKQAQTFSKPVLLASFGFHSWPLKFPDVHTQAEQAWYYQNILEQSRASNTGWLAWTLYDLPKGAAKHLGILESDGVPKAVVQVLNGQPIAAPTSLHRLFKYRYFLLLGCAAFGMLWGIRVLFKRSRQNM
jgi:hypothetical protein